MHFALIASEGPPIAAEDPYPERNRQIRAYRTAYAAAIAAELANRGMAPCIFCAPGSSLASQAAESGLAHTHLANNLLQRWRFWRWQRHLENLAIVALGEDSCKAARQLFKMRRHKPARLFSILFFTRRPLAAAAFAAPQTCVCGSSHIADQINALLQKSRGIKPEIRLAAPGLDLREYACAGQAEFEPDRFVFAMDGSLLPHSGALLVVRAMSALWQHEKVPPWEVRMFGAGERFEEIMEEAEKLGVLPRLSILLNQDSREMVCHANAWLAPGHAPEELPQTLWAGFAAGLPVICSDSQLHMERITDSRHAIIVKGDNPQQLAKSMLALLRDANMQDSYATAAASMRDFISLEGMARRVCDIIVPKAKEMPAANNSQQK